VKEDMKQEAPRDEQHSSATSNSGSRSLSQGSFQFCQEEASIAREDIEERSGACGGP
jgi:hypothetical protein